MPTRLLIKKKYYLHALFDNFIGYLLVKTLSAKAYKLVFVYSQPTGRIISENLHIDAFLI